MNEPTREQIDLAYQALPQPIREYLASTAVYDFCQNLGKQYGLHVDTVGVLPHLVTYLLLGLLNPAQFQQSLRLLSIPNQPAAAIIQELNEKVFKPLQEKVRNTPPEEPASREEEAAPVATNPIPAPASTPAAVAPAYTPPRTPPQPLVPAPAIIAPAQRPVPIPVPPPSVVPPPPKAPTPTPIPTPPTQTAPIYRPTTPATTTPTYQPPAAPPPASAPRPAAPPPVNLPGANGPVPEWSGFSEMPAPVSSPNPVTPAVPTPVQAPASKPAALHDVMKSYGVDPYREPLE
jgi:hypothetical protein